MPDGGVGEVGRKLSSDGVWQWAFFSSNHNHPTVKLHVLISSYPLLF